MTNKSLFSRFLTNKKVLLIVSLVLAFFFWIITADNINRTITEIPVVYNLPETVSGELKIFSASDEFVTVTVEGKRVLVDSLTADSFNATVNLSEVTKPVEKSFTVDVKGTGYDDFEIIKVEPDTVTLMIDRPMSKTVPLKTSFTYSPEGYYVDNNAPETVEITGPESIVGVVEYAQIGGNVISKDITTVTNNYSVSLHSKDSMLSKDELKYVTMSYSDVDVTFNYLVMKDNVPFSIANDEGISIPKKYFSTTPGAISVALPLSSVPDGGDGLTMPIDIGRLSQYQNEIYNLSCDVKDILGENMINKSEGIDKVYLRLDFSSFETKTFQVSSSRCKVTDLPEGYKYNLPPTFNVTVVGSKEAIESIDENKINIELQFTDVKPAADNYAEVPIKVNLNTNAFCWVYRQSPTISALLTAE